jgi:NAD(P)-dependent dehydrogenase (short-subunit alcohol dehydrogenase family)
MKIGGSVALVTGANRGLGRAYARELVSRGAAKVYGAARKANGHPPGTGRAPRRSPPGDWPSLPVIERLTRRQGGRCFVGRGTRPTKQDQQVTFYQVGRQGLEP